VSEQLVRRSADGHAFDALRATPSGDPKGSVVVLHPVYGLTSHMGEVCDRWAASGYVAVAPALFDRIGKGLTHPYGPDGVEAGSASYAALEEADVLMDVAACMDAVGGRRPRVVSGFCEGGTWAWVAAARLPFDAQVNFYGSSVPSRLDLAPRCPTVMHYGQRDPIVPPVEVDRIRRAHPTVLIHEYADAGHAFCNPEQETYDARAAAEAWQRSLRFLHRVRVPGPFPFLS